MSDNDHTQGSFASDDVTQSLYKQSAEIAGKNKTLSHLSSLYEISIQSLDERDLAQSVCETILENLSCEIVSLILVDQKTNTMKGLAVVPSTRVAPHINVDEVLDGLNHLSSQEVSFLQKASESRERVYSEDISDIWGRVLPDNSLRILTDVSHIHSSLVYPLLSDEKTIGLLILSLNRTLDQLLEHEKESLENTSFVIAVALDRARLYAELSEAVERETQQRMRAEELAENLKHMNERLTELDKMKTEFVSIASHQMRSPLTAISGYSSLILEGSYGATSREVKDAVSKIFRSSKSMSVSVDDFLNVTRIEQGRIQLDKETFDLCELVQNTYDEYVLVAEHRDLKLELAMNVDEPVMLYADRNKIKQSLNNLVDNALKYTKEGWVKLGLSPTDECATLTVADSGIGIPVADHASLFEKFTRATNANSATVQGTGLGLYIVKHFVNMHQGQIWFESDDGKGTTFFISLPITKEPDGHEHKTNVIDLLHESGPEPGERGSNRG